MTEKVTLGKPSSLLNGKTVGDFPFGIPVNIKITGQYVLFSHISVIKNKFSLYISFEFNLTAHVLHHLVFKGSNKEHKRCYKIVAYKVHKALSC